MIAIKHAVTLINQISDEHPYVEIKDFFTDLLDEFDENKIINEVLSTGSVIFNPDNLRKQRTLSHGESVTKTFKNPFSHMNVRIYTLIESLNSKLMISDQSLIANYANIEEQHPHYDFDMTPPQCEASKKSYSFFGIISSNPSKLIIWMQGK